MPPVVWGVLFAVVANFLFLRFKSTVQDPCFSNIRRKTITLWIPRLYPTVAQRAARWATQTLKNAARVTDASEVIEKSTIDFVGAIAAARRAGEAFAKGCGSSRMASRLPIRPWCAHKQTRRRGRQIRRFLAALDVFRRRDAAILCFGRSPPKANVRGTQDVELANDAATCCPPPLALPPTA